MLQEESHFLCNSVVMNLDVQNIIDGSKAI